jgi:hypothetical protein
VSCELGTWAIALFDAAVARLLVLQKDFGRAFHRAALCAFQVIALIAAQDVTTFAGSRYRDAPAVIAETFAAVAGDGRGGVV